MCSVDTKNTGSTDHDKVNPRIQVWLDQDVSRNQPEIVVSLVAVNAAQVISDE